MKRAALIVVIGVGCLGAQASADCRTPQGGNDPYSFDRTHNQHDYHFHPDKPDTDSGVICIVQNSHRIRWRSDADFTLTFVSKTSGCPQNPNFVVSPAGSVCSKHFDASPGAGTASKCEYEAHSNPCSGQLGGDPHVRVVTSGFFKKHFRDEDSLKLHKKRKH